MNRYIKITIFTFFCFCFNINKMYACDEDPIPVITSSPNEYKLYVDLNDTLTLVNNSYDPDGGPVTWNWTLFNYTTGLYTYGNEPNSTFVFDPDALGLEPGLYGVDVNVCDNEGNWINGWDYKSQTDNWCGTRDILVLGIKYFEDIDENELHYAPFGVGETFYYSLLPSEGANWEPDILYLYIKDASGNTVYLHYAFGWNDDIYLSSSIIWNGLGNRAPYNGQPVPPGNYTAKLDIRKQGTIMKKTNNMIVYDLTIESPYGDPTSSAGANYTNEKSFNSASPGVLTVACWARPTTENSDIYNFLENNKVRWTIEDIGNSTLTWDSYWPGTNTKGEGTCCVATFTGLPNNNSDFGLKEVKMELIRNGYTVDITKTTNIEVFFEPNARNNPGPPGEMPPDGIAMEDLVP